MNSKHLWFLLVGAAAAATVLPGSARAQTEADTATIAAAASVHGAAGTTIVYEREVFAYSRAGRRDPFDSLMDAEELGVRLEDLSLTGVMHDADVGQSVAVLSRIGSTRPLRVRVGDRVGGIRILSISQRSVQVLIEEFGVARRGTLELKSVTQKGTS